MKSTSTWPNYAPHCHHICRRLHRHLQAIRVNVAASKSRWCWKFPPQLFLIGQPKQTVAFECMFLPRAIDEYVILGSIEKWNVYVYIYVYIVWWGVLCIFVRFGFRMVRPNARAMCNTKGNPSWRNSKWNLRRTVDSAETCIHIWVTA